MWFFKMIRQFFFVLDKIVFNFIPEVYDLLIDIARTSVLTQADIKSMADRIYNFLIIFMVFKVTLSLITYVVNPDEFTDKAKGISKLSSNIVISLALLILTPYFFRYAYQFQTIILEDNSLGNLIFGDNGNSDFLNTAGDQMAFTAMTPFFTPDTSLMGLYNCITVTELDSNGNTIFNPECSGLGSDMKPTEPSRGLYLLTKESGGTGEFTLNALQNYVTGIEMKNLRMMFRIEMVKADDGDGNFIIDYKLVVSTAVGVCILLLLITFCMDVALRSIKLAFLQIIAPIPIISYVDPKSGKDGLFKKWYQMCFKTFLSLFIRILALYFAVYIIDKVTDWKLVDVVDGSYKGGFFLAIFIIIGALMFAKQLPKLLEGLGIKLDSEGFTLNPLKKLEKEALGGKQLAAVGRLPLKAAKGIGAGALVGGAALATGQGFRGVGKAFMGGMKGEKFGKNFSNSYSAARARKKQVDQMKADNVNPWEVKGAKFLNFFRGTTPAENVTSVSSGLKSIQEKYTQFETTAAGVDAIAKDFDKRKKAAEAKGDYAESKKWSAALDQRVKEIASSGGEIVTSLDSSWDSAALVSSDGSYTARASSYGDVSSNKALSNIANDIDQTVAEMNRRGKNVDGYQEVTASARTDIKKVKNQAQGSQQSVDTDAENQRLSNVAKYTGESKK